MACACGAAAACCVLCARTNVQWFFLSPARLTMHWDCAPFPFVSVIAKICITGNHLDTGSEDGKARLR